MVKPVAGTLFDAATHFEVGDLIYGINKARFYMTQLIGEYLGRNDEILSADHLNNQFLGTGVPGASRVYGAAASASLHHAPAAAKYKTWLESNTTKGGAKKTLTDVMMDTNNSEAVIDDLYDAPQRFHRITRSCKAGIAYATVENRKKIHFILTGIDMQKTVSKPDEAQNWITAKELRSIFRRWNDAAIKEGVLFWENEFVELAAPVPDNKGGMTKWDRKIRAVKAPWELNAPLWATYRPKDAGAFRLLNPNAPEFFPKGLNPHAPVFVPGKI